MNGANFLNAGAQTSGLTVGVSALPMQGLGESGIIRWLNEGADSPITGAFPTEDTAIVDPPSWFTGVPATYQVDARLPLTNFLLSGMWHQDEPDSASAPGSPFIVHGTNIAGTARLVSFADEPALSGGSGARVADGRRGRLLDGSVDQAKNTTARREGRGNPPLVIPARA